MASPKAEKGKKGKKEQDVPPDCHFSVGDYVLGTSVLPWHQLRLDENLDHGQIRTVDNANVMEILRNYKVNPPVQLELTVVKDQGAPPVLPFPVLGGGW